MRPAQLLGRPDPADAAARRQGEIPDGAGSEGFDREIERLQLRDRSVVHRHQRGLGARPRQHGAASSQCGEGRPHGGSGKVRLERRLQAVAEPVDRERASSLALRYALRELRGGLRGFYVFIACIALGVMAISGVGSLASGLADGLAREGRVILGGDLAFSLSGRAEDEAFHPGRLCQYPCVPDAQGGL